MKRDGIRISVALIMAIAISLPLMAAGSTESTGDTGELSGEITIALWRELDADPQHPAYAVHEILQMWNEMHENVTLNYEYVGGTAVTDKFQWIQTRAFSGTLPDAVMLYFPSDIFYDSDIIYNLAPHFDESNPYSTNPTWRDDFPHDAEVLRAATQPDGSIYVAGWTQSGNVGATAFAYNKDIFDEVGAEVPTTWAEFLGVQQKIKDAGYVPFLQPTAGPLGWLVDWPRWVLQWQLMDDVIDEVDVEQPFGVMSQKEIARGLSKGLFSVQDERYKEGWRMMKEWSQYWQPGFLAPPEGNLFLEGKAAMQHTMTLWIPQIAQNPNVTFNWGTFYQPQITSESSMYASGATPQRVGNSNAPASASMYLMVPATTPSKGDLDLTLDLLKFSLAPDQLDHWCANQTIPCFEPGSKVTDVYPNDGDTQREMGGFFDPPSVGNGSSNFYVQALGYDTGTQLTKLLQEYLGDATSLDDAMDELEEIINVALKDLIASNPEWDTSDW